MFKGVYRNSYFAYNRGADYADIIVDDEGVITIAVAEEYMNKEEEEKEEYMQINDVLLKKLMN